MYFRSSGKNASEQNTKMWSLLLSNSQLHTMCFFVWGEAMFYPLQISQHSQIIRPTETSLRWCISIVSFTSHLITCTCHPNTSCFLGPSNIKSPLNSICIMRYSAYQQTKLWDKADIILIHCNKGIPPF